MCCSSHWQIAFSSVCIIQYWQTSSRLLTTARKVWSGLTLTQTVTPILNPDVDRGYMQNKTSAKHLQNVLEPLTSCSYAVGVKMFHFLHETTF